MFQTVNALVLREVRYKEADRILTLLTDTEGKLTVKARGALRKSSRTAAATQQLTYSEMTLFGNKGRWTVNEASVREAFSGLREDMERFALGADAARPQLALRAQPRAVRRAADQGRLRAAAHVPVRLRAGARALRRVREGAGGPGPQS